MTPDERQVVERVAARALLFIGATITIGVWIAVLIFAYIVLVRMPL